MNSQWLAKPFEDCLDHVVYTRKVPRKDFLTCGAFPVISQEAAFINGYWDEPSDVFAVKRPVVIFGDHTQVLKYVDFNFVLGADGVKILCPRDFLLPRYFYYHLLAHPLKDLGYARHYRLLREQSIKYPPLPEQHRIVAILDKAFAAIATAKANTEKNLQNAHAIFGSQLQDVFTQRGKGWLEKKLSDLCEFENGDRGKNYPNRNEYVDSGIPWINTGHIRPDGTLSMETMNFITREKFHSLRSGKIQSGDLVYCLRGATLGKTALVAPLTEGAVASSLVILRPSPILDGRFLYFFLTSPPGQGLIKEFENGAAQPNLGAKSVAKYPISFPPADEQKAIADKLTVLRDETQHLASIYQRKRAALDELKKSLLHQAFTGQL